MSGGVPARHASSFRVHKRPGMQETMCGQVFAVLLCVSFYDVLYRVFWVTNIPSSDSGHERPLRSTADRRYDILVIITNMWMRTRLSVDVWDVSMTRVAARCICKIQNTPEHPRRNLSTNSFLHVSAFVHPKGRCMPSGNTTGHIQTIWPPCNLPMGLRLRYGGVLYTNIVPPYCTTIISY